MRKLFTIFLFIVTTFTIKAQTLEETMEYIQVNVLNYSLSKNEPTKCVDQTIKKTVGYYNLLGYPPVSIAVINLQDIRSVSYNSSSNFISIVITGNSYSQQYVNATTDKLEEQKKKETFIELILLPNTPEVVVQKIIKAIKHAASLGGAKLIKDDLF
ncbi:hypothetical protein LNQ81_12865 [Myroides sp. M-43]|uniref:hypothetical protein n=1 Tax=Myroides oncorhynchi TaxID=2893756 RepID=UPI001E63BC9B|nr:hypothetical protein [Myroides oncorhynchi]MCC9043565.1 hypothetical protein [Myroides oncorhynchi]